MSYPIGTILIDEEDGDEWVKLGRDKYRCTKAGKEGWIEGSVTNLSESYNLWIVLIPKENNFNKLYLKLKK